VKKWTVVIVLFVVALAACAFGMMAPRTPSLLDPERMVKQPVFESEATDIRADMEAETVALNKRIDAFNKKYARGIEDLKRQAERNAAIKTTILQVAAGGLQLAKTGQATPAALAGLALQAVLASAGGVALVKKKKVELELGEAYDALERTEAAEEHNVKNNAVIVQAVEKVRQDPTIGPQVRELLTASIKAVLAETNMSQAELDAHVKDAKAADVAG